MNRIGNNTANINPKLEKNLNYEKLKEASNFVATNNGELNENFKRLNKDIKRIVYAIISFTNKYDINIKNGEYNYLDLLEQIKQGDDIHDFGIATYIEDKIALRGIPKEAKESLAEKNDEIGLFWAAKYGWTPLSIDGNIEKILGYNKEDFLSGKIKYSEIIHPEDLALIEKKVKYYTETQETKFLQTYRIRKKDGEYLNVRDSTKCTYDEVGKIEYYYGSIKDITSEVKMHDKLISLNKELYMMNYLNQRTGLPNTNKLKKDIDRMENPFLVLLKIKNFGAINALYGFNEGDKILQNIINEFKTSLSSIGLELYNNNTSTHFGILGDIIDKDDLNKKMKQVTRLLTNFSVDTDYGKIHFDFVSGIACCEEDTFNKALTSMYLSKIEGKKFIKYTEQLRIKNEQKTRDNLYWINTILTAIEEKKFFPVYQGIRNNRTGKIDKYEALMRLDLNGEMVTPNYFLKYVSELGKDQEVTNIMLEKIIEDMTKHNKDVSINITKHDFDSKNLIDTIIELTEKHNINPNRIILEILEDISINDYSFLEKIKLLKDIGIRFSIDDFGSGYSNFTRLMYLTPEYLKVDGSLIEDLDKDDKKQKILFLITKLAEINNTKVVAEFVESHAVQKIIEGLGIEFSQGYLFSKPEKLDDKLKREKDEKKDDL